jgi:hypothetical protein
MKIENVKKKFLAVNCEVIISKSLAIFLLSGNKRECLLSFHSSRISHVRTFLCSMSPVKCLKSRNNSYYDRRKSGGGRGVQTQCLQFSCLYISREFVVYMCEDVQTQDPDRRRTKTRTFRLKSRFLSVCDCHLMQKG